MTAKVEILWRNRHGIQHKFLKWRTRPQTEAALAEYVEDYIELVRNGYRPEGHTEPPIPHCARIHFGGRVVAEWHKSLSPGFSAESLVAADERPGSGGIPTAAPRTADSGVVPTDGPLAYGNHSVPSAIPQTESGDFGAEQGRTVAKAGRPVESRSHELVR